MCVISAPKSLPQHRNAAGEPEETKTMHGGHTRIAAHAASHRFKDIQHVYHLKLIDRYLNANQILLTPILLYIVPSTVAHSITKWTANEADNDNKYGLQRAILNNGNLFCDQKSQEFT